MDFKVVNEMLMNQQESGSFMKKNSDPLMIHGKSLIPPEQISCIHFLFHIIQTGIIAVCKDGIC